MSDIDIASRVPVTRMTRICAQESAPKWGIGQEEAWSLSRDAAVDHLQKSRVIGPVVINC
jgi:hypothetical protein